MGSCSSAAPADAKHQSAEKQGTSAAVQKKAAPKPNAPPASSSSANAPKSPQPGGKRSSPAYAPKSPQPGERPWAPKFDGGTGVETTAPTIGPNCVRAYTKGHAWLDQVRYYDSDEHRGRTHHEQRWQQACGKLATDLQIAVQVSRTSWTKQLTTSIDKCVAQLRSAEEIADRRERAHARWKAVILPYTGQLFQDLNKSARLDLPGVDLFARYMAAVMKDDYASGFCCPPSARYEGGTVYRGVAIDAASLKMYRKGRQFTWCNFVSTTKNRDLQFAAKKDVIFELQVPAYSDSFRVWDLERADASQYKNEKEVLIPPFTKWEVLAEPERQSDGKTLVRVKGVGQYMRGRRPRVCTVIVHPDGFAGGAGMRWARHAFHHGAPSWAIGPGTGRPAWTPVRGHSEALGLFTDGCDAAEWISAVEWQCPDVVFRILTTGARVSEALLHLHFSHFGADTIAPCEVLVFTGGAAHHPDGQPAEKYDFGMTYQGTACVHKTADEKIVNEFLSPLQYDDDADQWVPMATRRPPVWVPEKGLQPASFEKLSYCTRKWGKDGVIYGGALYKEGALQPPDPDRGCTVVPRTVETQGDWEALVIGEGVPMVGLAPRGASPRPVMRLARLARAANMEPGQWTQLLLAAAWSGDGVGACSSWARVFYNHHLSKVPAGVIC